MLILLAHGSRDPRWRNSLHSLANNVGNRLPSEEVRLAFMQFEGPALQSVVEDAILAGHRGFRLLPLFMASAGHVDKDIKPLVAELIRTHPEASFDLMIPVGEDVLFPRLISDIAKEPPASQ